MLEVKFEYNRNRAREAIADRENCNTAAIRDSRYTARGIDEGELFDIVSKVVAMKKMNMSQRK